MTPDHPNTPALSEEEWAKAHGSLYADAGYTTHWGADVFYHEDDPGSIRIPSDGSRLHALAALCLHQQPFGFSQSDVETLQAALEWHEYLDAAWCPKCHDQRGGFKMSSPPICTACGWKLRVHPQELEENLRSLASRLSNLLPKP